MRLLLVFNPQAGAGRAARLLPGVRSKLEAFATVDVLQTGGAGDGTRLVAKADLSTYDGLIAAGGDGTLLEVLNGLYTHARAQRIPLGLVPVGTGNAFSRDLGLLPGDWEKAVDLIKAGCMRQVDVGRVETPNETWYFLNIVGVGLPVDAMNLAAKLKFLGNSAYSLAAFWRVIKLKSYPLSIEIDGKTINQDSMFLEISNTRYTGTSFLMAPDAVLDDGLLDVTLLGTLSRWRLLRLFPTIYKGHHVRYDEVQTCKARVIRITAPAGLVLAPDGELKGCTPATITCLERDLQIFGP
jgi:diacylglycerol kinase (ATP)